MRLNDSCDWKEFRKAKDVLLLALREADSLQGDVHSTAEVSAQVADCVQRCRGSLHSALQEAVAAASLDQLAHPSASSWLPSFVKNSRSQKISRGRAEDLTSDCFAQIPMSSGQRRSDRKLSPRTSSQALAAALRGWTDSVPEELPQGAYPESPFQTPVLARMLPGSSEWAAASGEASCKPGDGRAVSICIGGAEFFSPASDLEAMYEFGLPSSRCPSRCSIPASEINDIAQEFEETLNRLSPTRRNPARDADGTLNLAGHRPAEFHSLSPNRNAHGTSGDIAAMTDAMGLQNESRERHLGRACRGFFPSSYADQTRQDLTTDSLRNDCSSRPACSSPTGLSNRRGLPSYGDISLQSERAQRHLKAGSLHSGLYPEGAHVFDISSPSSAKNASPQGHFRSLWTSSMENAPNDGPRNSVMGQHNATARASDVRSSDGSSHFIHGAKERLMSCSINVGISDAQHESPDQIPNRGTLTGNDSLRVSGHIFGGDQVKRALDSAFNLVGDPIGNNSSTFPLPCHQPQIGLEFSSSPSKQHIDGRIPEFGTPRSVGSNSPELCGFRRSRHGSETMELDSTPPSIDSPLSGPSSPAKDRRLHGNIAKSRTHLDAGCYSFADMWLDEGTIEMNESQLASHRQGDESVKQANRKLVLGFSSQHIPPESNPPSIFSGNGQRASSQNVSLMMGVTNPETFHEIGHVQNSGTCSTVAGRMARDALQSSRVSSHSDSFDMYCNGMRDNGFSSPRASRDLDSLDPLPCTFAGPSDSKQSENIGQLAESVSVSTHRSKPWLPNDISARQDTAVDLNDVLGYVDLAESTRSEDCDLCGSDEGTEITSGPDAPEQKRHSLTFGAVVSFGPLHFANACEPEPAHEEGESLQNRGSADQLVGTDSQDGLMSHIESTFDASTLKHQGSLGLVDGVTSAARHLQDAFSLPSGISRSIGQHQKNYVVDGDAFGDCLGDVGNADSHVSDAVYLRGGDEFLETPIESALSEAIPSSYHQDACGSGGARQNWNSFGAGPQMLDRDDHVGLNTLSLHGINMPIGSVHRSPSSPSGKSTLHSKLSLQQDDAVGDDTSNSGNNGRVEDLGGDREGQDKISSGSVQQLAQVDRDSSNEFRLHGMSSPIEAARSQISSQFAVDGPSHPKLATQYEDALGDSPSSCRGHGPVDGMGGDSRTGQKGIAFSIGTQRHDRDNDGSDSFDLPTVTKAFIELKRSSISSQVSFSDSSRTSAMSQVAVQLQDAFGDGQSDSRRKRRLEGMGENSRANQNGLYSSGAQMLDGDGHDGSNECRLRGAPKSLIGSARSSISSEVAVGDSSPTSKVLTESGDMNGTGGDSGMVQKGFSSNLGAQHRPRDIAKSLPIGSARSSISSQASFSDASPTSMVVVDGDSRTRRKGVSSSLGAQRGFRDVPKYSTGSARSSVSSQVSLSDASPTCKVATDWKDQVGNRLSESRDMTGTDGDSRTRQKRVSSSLGAQRGFRDVPKYSTGSARSSVSSQVSLSDASPTCKVATDWKDQVGNKLSESRDMTGTDGDSRTRQKRVSSSLGVQRLDGNDDGSSSFSSSQVTEIYNVFDDSRSSRRSWPKTPLRSASSSFSSQVAFADATWKMIVREQDDTLEDSPSSCLSRRSRPKSHNKVSFQVSPGDSSSHSELAEQQADAFRDSQNNGDDDDLGARLIYRAGGSVHADRVSSAQDALAHDGNTCLTSLPDDIANQMLKAIRFSNGHPALDKASDDDNDDGVLTGDAIGNVEGIARIMSFMDVSSGFGSHAESGTSRPIGEACPEGGLSSRAHESTSLPAVTSETSHVNGVRELPREEQVDEMQVGPCVSEGSPTRYVAARPPRLDLTNVVAHVAKKKSSVASSVDGDVSDADSANEHSTGSSEDEGHPVHTSPVEKRTSMLESLLSRGSRTGTDISAATLASLNEDMLAHRRDRRLMSCPNLSSVIDDIKVPRFPSLHVLQEKSGSGNNNSSCNSGAGNAEGHSGRKSGSNSPSRDNRGKGKGAAASALPKTAAEEPPAKGKSGKEKGKGKQEKGKGKEEKGKGKVSPPPGKGGQAKAKPKAKPSGPEPHKPNVVPNNPMKKLFWNSFILDEEALASRRSTVWGAIDEDGNEEFDANQLEEMFGTKEAGKKSMLFGEASHSRRNTRVRVRVFEESRRRQVCVMLARLPCVDETIQAVLEMDDMRLNKDQVELLLANAPQTEELTALRSAAAETQHDNEITNEDAVDWDDAEAFILRLSGVPSFALRIQMWAFENSYDERFDFFQQAAMDVKSACAVLRHSPRIQRLLSLALSVGNYLNGGTSRGRADGFTVDALAQMRTVKASKAGVTLVDYIVEQLERSRPQALHELFMEGGEVQVVRKAMRHKLADLNVELSAYIAQADGLVKRVATSRDDELDIRGLRVESRMRQLTELLKLFAEADEDYHQLCSWFHDGQHLKRERPPDEFFTLWDGFLEAVRMALESLGAGRKKVRGQRSSQKLMRSASMTDAVEEATKSPPPVLSRAFSDMEDSRTTSRRNSIRSVRFDAEEDDPSPMSNSIRRRETAPPTTSNRKGTDDSD